MPAYLRKNGYKDLTDSYHTVWQDAYKTKENCFEWIMSRPASFDNFNQYMASRREHQVTWIQFYPVEEDATQLDPARPLFVDIGGGIGHQAAEFKEKYPTLPGKVVLQDLPFAIDHALPTPGVDNQALDFFTGQPVKSESPAMVTLKCILTGRETPNSTIYVPCCTTGRMRSAATFSSTPRRPWGRTRSSSSTTSWRPIRV